MIEAYKDMDQRGCLNKYEKNLMKQGVMFRPIKLAILGLRDDEITEREIKIKKGIFVHRRQSS